MTAATTTHSPDRSVDRPVDLVVFDMAGTTIEEGSIVYDALRDAVTAAGVTPTRDQLDAVKGRDKVTAIRRLLTEGGADASDEAVQAGFERFTTQLEQRYATDRPTPMPGVEAVIDELHARGIKVALTTGFTAEVARSVLDAVGWSPGRYDALVTTDDVPAGRPAPYMIHRAMLLTGAQDVRRVVSVGDTTADIGSARNAGAISVGVLSGDTDAAVLRAAGPDHLLASAADLLTIPELA